MAECTRKQFHVTYRKGLDKPWLVTLDGEIKSEHTLKRDAAAAAIELARVQQPSQVVIHKRDGKIQTEFTYGDDPERTKG